MAKRRPKKAVKKTDAALRLRNALAKCTKGKLVDILMELAGEGHATFRRLAAHVELEPPPEEIAAASGRVGFIYDRELAAVREHFEAPSQ